ncbi:hypothetical protein DPMN_047242 [Dreissena polymorpha]|uniref:Uncharacterized protein n=1 Tax=Dreissena polymorpha TaxID=45954 RepID=A0A9D4D7E0_DREPO|nr:hypothetical protein DPMN_047242 [Dreissena polymorpha]
MGNCLRSECERATGYGVIRSGPCIRSEYKWVTVYRVSTSGLQYTEGVRVGYCTRSENGWVAVHGVRTMRTMSTMSTMGYCIRMNTMRTMGYCIRMGYCVLGVYDRNDDDEYEPVTLRSIVGSIDGNFKEQTIIFHYFLKNGKQKNSTTNEWTEDKSSGYQKGRPFASTGSRSDTDQRPMDKSSPEARTRSAPSSSRTL